MLDHWSMHSNPLVVLLALRLKLLLWEARTIMYVDLISKIMRSRGVQRINTLDISETMKHPSNEHCRPLRAPLSATKFISDRAIGESSKYRNCSVWCCRHSRYFLS
jgi:hypothetical protein